jgi:quercetin dioxygenase-like cupin family protein
MDRAAFEAGLKQDGFELSEGRMEAGCNNPDHTHPFDARLFVLSGEITIGRDGKSETFGAGDTCSVDANTMHSEKVGGEDVIYLTGRRAV